MRSLRLLGILFLAFVFVFVATQVKECGGKLVVGDCEEKGAIASLEFHNRTVISDNESEKGEVPARSPPPDNGRDSPPLKELEVEVALYCDYGYIKTEEGADIFIRFDGKSFKTKAEDGVFSFAPEGCGKKAFATISKKGFLPKSISFDLPPCDCRLSLIREERGVEKEPPPERMEAEDADITDPLCDLGYC